jgi:NDP-4-keto-2,6-dideoxyhexose 3-C-methyltransferase
VIDSCRACGSPNLTQVLDLGNQYLSDFRDDASKPPRSPLALLWCSACTLAQLSETVDRELLYTERYGYRSGVNEGIRADLKSVVDEALRWHGAGRHAAHSARWLDIASNDGTLLSFVPSQFHRTGVDPVAKFADVAREHADRLVVGFFDPATFYPASADVVTSVSMFYDLDDPGEFVAGVAEVLAPDGVWVIQQNYLLDMLQATSYDNVCHEHIAYYSLRALVTLLDEHGLEVVSVSRSPINGGCIRTVVAHKGARRPDGSVADLLQVEEAAGLGDRGAYRAFAGRVSRAIVDLRELVDNARALGQTVYIYAASTRGAVMWQAAELDERTIGAVVERQAEKVGRFFSPLGVRIISEEQARREHPDYMIVGPWWFRDQFVAREADYLAAGGKLVFPLPRLEIVG